MKGIRFSDEDDFNDIHDRINIIILKNHEKLVKLFLDSFLNDIFKKIKFKSNIVGEPRICKIAFPDAIINISLEVDTNIHNIKRELTIKLAVEIKSYIKSFGETLRQLQIYKDCLRSSNYHEIKRKLGIDVKDSYNYVYLVTPDHRFDDAFKDQGFEVLDPSFFGDFYPSENSQKRIDNF